MATPLIHGSLWPFDGIMMQSHHDALKSNPILAKGPVMRTTIDLDYDTLVAAKEAARMENVSLGKVISRLVRQALTGGVAQQAGNVPAATATAPAPARRSAGGAHGRSRWR